MNETETRAEYIDPALRAAGWGVVEGSRIRREYPITLGRIGGDGQHGRPLKADYVLIYRNRKLAVVEAKAWDYPVSEGLGQAKNYADKIAVRFAYATNGQGIYGVDMHTGHEGSLEAYPTPEELWAQTFTQPDPWRETFSLVPFEDRGGSHPARYYQDIAVERVMAALSEGKKRILLTLATGTGKTFIAFQIAWKLFHSRWNLSGGATRRPRILFLADRNILANQAYNQFSAFPEDALVRIAPDEIRKKGRVPTNGNLFFTIFQTFMSGPDDTPHFGEYPPDFFDFIIIDECHRGGANDESTWRDILDHFAPAVQLGLTATPKRTENADTYAYFGDPVYVYSLKDGINDGYLTPFRVRQITTSLDEYVYTADDDLLDGEIEPGRIYTEPDFNRVIEIMERERHRVQIFMKMIDQRQKTIVFCATQDHALAVRDLINQLKSNPDPHYCERVTANDGALGEQHLRDFQDNEKTIPTILTTSQKLSTGVDARNIRNIVLMRPINSIIEFKQIIGRGTRLYDGKGYFTVYDFVKAYHHFSDPEWDGEPLEPADDPIPEDRPRPRQESGEEKPDFERPAKIRVKLADGKARQIQNMIVTSFWHPDGTPMTAQQFMQQLFGELPQFFQSEEELRQLWCQPETRTDLLHRLAEKGFGPEQMAEMQRIIDAQHSDLFDVLAYVAYALPTVTRAQRAIHAREVVQTQFNAKQQSFINFVLDHYVQIGVDELAPDKLTPLLRLRYNNAISDAVADLGKPEEISHLFTGFQRHLYPASIAA